MNATNATPKMSKKIRDLAAKAYDDYGQLRRNFTPKTSGSFRAVLVEDGVAIKFALTDSEAAHNRAEWDAWRSFPASVQRITAKPFCISACGRVMAVEAVETTLAKDPNRDYYCTDLDEFNSNLKSLLQDGGFDEDQIQYLLSDNHANNIGVREDGDLCWIDYASWAER